MKKSGNGVRPAKPARPRFTRALLRPTVYRAFTRFMLALTAALLWNEFLNRSHAIALGWPFLFLGAFFAIMAWMNYLRLDGLRVPQLDRRLFDWKRRPARAYGDMIDHVDEDVVLPEELDEDEQTLCRLVANLVCCALFVILGAVL